MSKIDVSQWKEFKVGDLFDIGTGASVSKAILDMHSEGNIPRISVSNENNGVIETFSKFNDKNMRYFTNFISVNFFGHAFYHSGLASLEMKVHALTLKDHRSFTTSIALFLVSLLNVCFKKENFDYGHQLSSSKLKTGNFRIKLPVTSDDKPDWEYMDNYIAKLAARAHRDVGSLNQTKPKTHKINIDNWKKFKVGDLFDIRPSKYIRENGKAMTNIELFDNGDNPVIVNSSSDNGIGGYTTQKVTERGGVISYSDTTDGPDTMFYQAKSFVGYSHVKVMEPRDGVCSNLESMLYLTAVIKKALQQKDYTFTNKLTTPLMKNTIIQLPVDDDGQPNFDYMTKYIKLMQASAKCRLQSYQSVGK